MGLEQWVVPPVPGESLVERDVELGGRTVRVAVHSDLQEGLERLVPALVAAAAGVDGLGDGTELPLPWAAVRVDDLDEVDGVLRLSVHDTRTPLRLSRERVQDLSQLVWVHEAWRAVLDAAGLDPETAVAIDALATTVDVTPGMLKRSYAAEARHRELGGKTRWFVGEAPFDERLITHMASSIQHPANLFGKRPELVPALCLPSGWRARVEPERGITRITDAEGVVVHDTVEVTPEQWEPTTFRSEAGGRRLRITCHPGFEDVAARIIAALEEDPDWNDGDEIEWPWANLLMREDDDGFVLLSRDLTGDPRTETTEDLTRIFYHTAELRETCSESGLERHDIRWDDDVLVAYDWEEASRLQLTRRAASADGASGWLVDTFPASDGGKGPHRDEIVHIEAWRIFQRWGVVAACLALPPGTVVVIDGDERGSVVPPGAAGHEIDVFLAALAQPEDSPEVRAAIALGEGPFEVSDRDPGDEEFHLISAVSGVELIIRAGAVSTIFLPVRPEPGGGRYLRVDTLLPGLRASSTREQVRAALGEPEVSRTAWDLFRRDGRVVHTEFEGEHLRRITLMAKAVWE